MLVSFIEGREEKLNLFQKVLMIVMACSASENEVIVRKEEVDNQGG